MSAALRIGVFLAPVRDTPDHIALAEDLGFASAWCYDSPLLYHDPFATLARAADRTSRIGLGVGVVVPGLRTPAATSAALRTLSALAPGRMRAAVGAGFTGRFTLGVGPVPLARLEARGSSTCGPCSPAKERPHPDGGRPIVDMPVPGAGGAGEVPLYVSCRGRAGPGAGAPAGRRGHDRDLLSGRPRAPAAGGHRARDLPLAVHAVGAVADEGEPLDSPRLRAAGGPGGGRGLPRLRRAALAARGAGSPRLQVAGRGLRHRGVGGGTPPSAATRSSTAATWSSLTLPQDTAIRRRPRTSRASPSPGRGPTSAPVPRPLPADGVTELAIQPGGDVPYRFRRLAHTLL